MEIEVKIIKGLPKNEIEQFEDRTVYNAAVYTRETTKANNSFPYRTGRLQRSEVAMPISGSNKTYSLLSGVDYAKYVWKMNNVNWTNPQTKPQWYYYIFDKQQKIIMTAAVIKAKKGL